MEAKHTPGPWTVGQEMNSERPGSVPVVALVRDSLEGKMHVAFVNGKAGEQEANARLIAAAPDLLAALKAAQGFIDAVILWGQKQPRSVTEGMPGPYEVETTVAATIARATGGGA